jgi:hypothetical protein
MNDNIYKGIVITLLVSILISQFRGNDVGRYEFNNETTVVFDNKTGDMFTTLGHMNLLENSKEKMKEYEAKKANKKDSN